MSRFCALALLTVSFLASPLSSRSADKPDPKPADGPKTIVYDVSDMIHQPGGRTGFDRIDEIVEVLVTTVHPGGWGSEKEGASRLRELNGTKLEIHTTPKNHAEIVDLLAALRGRNDLDVNLRADLFELDRAVYEKEILPKLRRRAAVAVGDDIVTALQKKASLVVTHAVPTANGKEWRPLSLRQAFSYVKSARAGPGGQVNDYSSGFQGLTVRVTPVISPDRRTVSLKITQQATELVELKKRTRLAVLGNDVVDVAIEVPELAETAATTTVDVDDGIWALAAVAYRTPAAKGKDRVWVLAVRPVIYIGEDDKALRGNNPK
jgi:hypothetical protein